MENTPALGSPESAVLGIMNMIATLANRSEKYIAVWLDAYYQARKAYEESRGAAATAAEPEAPKAESEAPKAEPEKPKAEPEKPKADHKAPKEEPKKARKVKSDNPGNTYAADAAKYKREVLAKLQAARARGITAAQIEEAAGDCSVTDDDVFMILDGRPRNISVYRAIDAALAKLE